MKTRILLSAFLILTFLFQLPGLRAQTATFVPPGNQVYSGLEKNMLFNAQNRYTVTQTGTRGYSLPMMFNGEYDPQYITGFDGAAGNAVSIEISDLPNRHIQIGGYVGFSARYLPAKRFKIEMYDAYNNPNTWRTVADETNNSLNYYSVFVSGGSFTKIRFTFYEGSSDPGYEGWIGLSELFFLHGEAAKAYDGLMVQYSPNGSVGIGTTNPDPNFKLSVAGPIRAKEIKVESNWADFVFKPGYPLMPIKQVEEYIKANQHLPGIPDEKTIQKEGVSLGEINTKLLQKIEELTLYMIELKKENEKQQKEIDLLKGKKK